MTGPQFRRSIGSKHLSFNVAGLLLLTGILWVVLSPELAESMPATSVALTALAVAAAYQLVSWILDRSLAGLSGAGISIGPTSLSMIGAIEVRCPATERVKHRYTILAFGIYAVFGLLFLSLAGASREAPGRLATAIFAFALTSSMSCLVRLCAVRGLPGGFAADWYLTILTEDEDAADTAAKVLSYGASLVIAFTGFLVLAQPGPWSGWGLATIAFGLECLILTQWYTRRERWMNAAMDRPLAAMGHSRLPTISHAAPISELLSIFAVEGNRAMVVVVDERGRPSGVIQLRQLKAAVHSGGSTHPEEVMVTLSRVPHLPRETTVFDAALYLERTGHLALVTDSPSGAERVVSLAELFRIVD